MSEKDQLTCQVFHFDLYGTREEKYEYLRSHSFNDVAWQQLNPQAPSFFFVPKNFSLQEEYNKGFMIDELMKVRACGIVTSRDNLLIRNTPQELEQVRKDFENLTEEEFRRKYDIKDNSDWTYSEAKEDIKITKIVPILYRPFDERYVLYTPKKGVISRPRFDIMHHLLYGYYRDSEGVVGTHSFPSASKSNAATEDGCVPANSNGCPTDAPPWGTGNIALNVCKQQSTFDFQHVLVSEYITDKCTLSAQTKEAGYVFPLYLYPSDSELGFETEHKPNLDETIWRTIENWVKYSDAFRPRTANEKAGLLGFDAEPEEQHFLTPEDIFDYIYGVLHSPAYRTKYKELLKVDFPRIPYPKNAGEFEHFRFYGHLLRELHLMHNVPESGVEFPEAGSMMVDYIKWDSEWNTDDGYSGRVYINDAQYFDGVPTTAWEMYIGGYQPAQKWLQAHKGRALSSDDIDHYRNIITVLCETDRLMKELDAKMLMDTKE